MTATHQSRHHIGDRIRVRRDGQDLTERVSAVHAIDDCGEYVIGANRGIGGVLILRTTSTHATLLSPVGSTR